MQGIEADADNSEPRVTLDSDAQSTRSNGVQRAADAASAVTRALSAAGYEPRHLSVTSSESGELVLVARLEEQAAPRQIAVRQPIEPGAESDRSRTPLIARLLVGLTLGVLLGFLGLPRVEVPQPGVPAVAPQPTPALPEILSVQDLGATTTTNADAPTPAPQPTPTLQPTLQPSPTPVSALFDMPLTTPIPGWSNDVQGTAWFSADGYHLYARNPGQFVAAGVPLPQPVQNVTVSATFHKLGGPGGGGYGLILRDQSPTSERDGHNQRGEYLVFEVGDLGDIGVWQRDQTHWIDIVPWRHSQIVRTDRGSNALTVTARGTRLLFQVNGQTVADLNYDKLAVRGGIGIFVGGDLNEVGLDRLRIDNS